MNMQGLFAVRLLPHPSLLSMCNSPLPDLGATHLPDAPGQLDGSPRHCAMIDSRQTAVETVPHMHLPGSPSAPTVLARPPLPPIHGPGGRFALLKIPSSPSIAPFSSHEPCMNPNGATASPLWRLASARSCIWNSKFSSAHAAPSLHPCSVDRRVVPERSPGALEAR